MYFHLFFPFFFLDWKWGLRKLTCPPLSGTYEKLVLETSSITRRQDNMPMIQKTAETVDIVWEGKKASLPFFCAGVRYRVLAIDVLTNAKITAN